MNNFRKTMGFVIAWEGGLSNHPNDRGGETKYGISQKAHPGVDIKTLTKMGAYDIYHHKYWGPIKGDDLPWPLCLVVMDAAVNHGPMAAARMLQKDLPVLQDGLIGQQTLKAIHNLDMDHVALSLHVIQCRREHYADLIRRHPEQASFARGWENRMKALEARCK